MIAAIFEILGGIGGAIAALSSALLAIVTGLLVRERGKRKEAQREARTHKEMRDNERDAAIQTDETLADRITHRR
jgi:hypothetical protein